MPFSCHCPNLSLFWRAFWAHALLQFICYNFSCALAFLDRDVQDFGLSFAERGELLDYLRKVMLLNWLMRERVGLILSVCFC